MFAIFKSEVTTKTDSKMLSQNEHSKVLCYDEYTESDEPVSFFNREVWKIFKTKVEGDHCRICWSLELSSGQRLIYGDFFLEAHF